MSSPSRNGVDSPSAQLLSETRHHAPSPRRTDSVDSPSRQLLREFSRLLIDSDRHFNDRLDQVAAEQERAHREALARAAEEHERVRQSAERARERFQFELEKERKRREDEERRELERARQERVESEAADRKRELEQLKRAEEERKRAEEEKAALAQAQARAKAQKEKEEADEVKRKADQAESDRKAGEATEAARKASLLQPPASQSTQGTTTQPVSKPVTTSILPPASSSSSQPASELVHPRSEHEATHQQYLQIHQRLKEMRRNMQALGKQIPDLKKRMGDMRREIRKSLGQLTIGKGANAVPTRKIREVLLEASRYGQPTVDVRQFIISPPTLPEESDYKIPGLLIYLLNIFAKGVIEQFVADAATKTEAADPIGVVAVSMFSQTDLKWRDTSLVDILFAKFHRDCPVLWGIYGNEKTEGGRQRLGWAKEDGAWIREQTHGERMTGLGAGFAALSLRDFSKTRLQNPIPNTHYWRALACIINTPPQEATQTHFLVLKAMVENYAGRFIGFYGQAAVMALRKALVEFPAQAPKSAAASAVAVLPEVFKRDLRLTL